MVILLNSIFLLIILDCKYIPVDMSERERAELSAERQRMTEEMEGMSKQRETLGQERAEFIEDRKRLNEEKSQLQMRINDSEKVFIFVLLTLYIGKCWYRSGCVKVTNTPTVCMLLFLPIIPDNLF